ncbi:ribonuclease H-like domain-containing protein [Candidatus Azambacteria bacterium]|nr:ribonuclease H-like domain-containing protein [Candidatus Azambacteria bacterium]MBI3685536.1 ribonuclease H-like domain-containing protein [Candidatus Azambacteria bacterium]
MKDHIVLDLETQYEFSEVGGRDYPHLLKVSLVGVYSYGQDRFLAFEEKDIPALETLLKNTGLLVGFNTKFFDYAVLQPYLKEVDLKTIPACDLMEDVTNVLGHRLSLDSIAEATLGAQKIAHGLDAIRYFREGNMEALKKYCLDDVRLTRDVFEYGKKHGKVFYHSKYRPDALSAPVSWNMHQYGGAQTAFPEAPAPASPRAHRDTGNYSLF